MPHTILFVEDRPNPRISFCDWLREQGYNTLEAACASEFKNRASKADVIILDISIPIEPNGPEVSTAGLDALLDLQKEYPNNPAIHNPIIRSMWSPDLFGQKYHSIIKKARLRWCSREVPVAELLGLIQQTLGELPPG